MTPSLSLQRRLIKKFYVHVCYPVIALYIKKERPFKHKEFKLTILPGVFHPGFFFSTKYFFSFLEQQPIENKKCLEIGCGSGLLSLLMLRKKGIVTAIDINPKALENTALNEKKNQSQFSSSLRLIHSDLFDQVPADVFEFIVIAPPYFFDEVSNDSEYAWYCGKNGEYFSKLFSQIITYINAKTVIYMILADNCDISRIQKMAEPHGLCFTLAAVKRIWWEDNFIFKLNKA